MAADKLKHKRRDRVLLVRRVLKLREGSSRRFFEGHTEGDPKYSISRAEFALRDTRFVENPWSIDAVAR